MLNEYLHYTSTQESPEIYHKWVCLSVAAAALERNVWLDRGFYKVFPNLYTILIGDSGKFRKSTAIEIGKDALFKVENSKPTVVEGQITLQKLIEDMGGMIADPITGKFVPKSRLFLLAPELAVFLHGQQAPEMVQFLTDLYSCKTKPWHYKTKTRGEVQIDSPCINFLGASTAEWLSCGLSNSDFGGGFTGRCMFIVARNPRPPIAHPHISDDQKASFAKCVEQLSRLRTLRGEYSLNDKAKAYYGKWYDVQKATPMADRLKGYHERKPENVLKLALLKTTFDEKTQVGVEEVEWSLHTLEEAEQTMTSAFQFIGTDENVLAELILHHLDAMGGKDKYVRILSYLAPRLKGINQFDAILTMLAKREKIRRYDRNGQQYIVLTELRDTDEQVNESISKVS